MEKILSFDEYGELARRTLSPKVAESNMLSTLNAATGLASETGEIMEFYQRGSRWKGDRDHRRKELGDWIWYWSLMVWCYGFKNSQIRNGKDNVEDAQHGLYALRQYDPEECMFAMTTVVGRLNEFVKKQFFHFHPVTAEDESRMKDLLLVALYSWFQLCRSHEVTPANVLWVNIDKLRKRYPEGFSTDKSLNRAPGDV